MPKYMLTRDQKRQPLSGFRDEDRRGKRIRHKVDVIFEPGKAIDTGDVEMSHWVEAGLLVAIPDVEDVSQKKATPPPPPPYEEGNGADYEELSDGKFKCLHCGKKYKTETGVVKHIEAVH